MKRLLLALAFLLLLAAPSYAQKSKAALVSEVNVNWPDNTTGAITPALLRSTVIDIINSYTNFAYDSIINYTTGYITTVASAGVKSAFTQIVSPSTVDNVVASALNGFSCTVTPVLNLVDCGTSTSCTGAGIVTIASINVTPANTAIAATIITPAVTGGDFVGWSVSPGICSTINVQGSASIHAN
jgi:ABC-type proline/glycine betaine transport system substrate-binding protein